MVHTANVSKKLQLGVLLLGAFVAVFNISVTNVAIPSIAQALNASGLQIHMIANGFTLSLASFVLVAGAVGDKYGRKKLFVMGALLMAITSTLSAYSTDPRMLITWRILAGFSMGLLYPTTLSMITTIFQNPKERIVAIGLWTGVSAAGAALAPVIAGAFLEWFFWGSVYLFSVPLVILAFFMGLKYLPDIRKENMPSVDWLGGGLSVGFVFFLLVAIILYPVYKMTMMTFVPFFSAIALLFLFLLHERKSKTPLLDLSVFTNRRFSVACFVITLVAFAQLGVMFLAQQYLQNVLHFSTLAAGAASLPMSIAALVLSPIAARLDTRFGSRAIVTPGLFIIGVAFVTALFWTVDSPYAQVLVYYLLIGVGIGLVLTPMTNAIMNSLPQEKAGVGSAMNDVTRDFGSSLGIAVNGTIAAVGYDTLLTKVYNNLPSPQREDISNTVAGTIASSLSGADEVAKRYPQEATQLIAFANHAFLHGQIEAMTLSAILSFSAAIVVWLFLPKNTTGED